MIYNRNSTIFNKVDKYMEKKMSKLVLLTDTVGPTIVAQCIKIGEVTRTRKSFEHDTFYFLRIDRNELVAPTRNCPVPFLNLQTYIVEWKEPGTVMILVDSAELRIDG